jgi:phosphate starvation-inducible protein PhoH and related proteins
MADLSTPQPAPDNAPQTSVDTPDQTSAQPAAPEAGGVGAADAAGAAEPAHTIVISPDVQMVNLLGPRDELLRTVERAFPQLDVRVRGNEVTLIGPAGEIALLERLLDELLAVLRVGQSLSADAVERSIGMLRTQTSERPADVLTLNILSNRGRTIRPKTLNQKRYVDAIDANTVVFGIGPAGTGKTYLAMAKAVQALQAKQVSRIILTRPAVEAGERLGFLPGTLTEKIDPYLRPLYDALHDMIDPESIPRLMAAGTIEVAPLAYMRGRSLNDAFIILDEAQNTSPEQMKMFLTRLGFGSQMVVTGDVTQIDLPSGTQSGLKIVQSILDGLDDVHFAMLTSHDVVRHRLVSAIVDAYERFDVEQQPLTAQRDAGARPRGGRGNRR